MMDADARVEKRLLLPSDESSDTESQTGEFTCDGYSSLVALALLHNVPLFGAGFTGNNSGITVRVGYGAFGIVNLSRLSLDISGQFSWYGEEDLFGPARPRGQKVAVKSVFRHIQNDYSRAFADIAKEIRVLGHPFLRTHENILDIIGLTWDDDFCDSLETSPRQPMLVLEYANCGSLEDFFTLDGVNFSWVVKMGILSDVAHGLEAVDDAGVLHGDLKLSNVLVFRIGDDHFKAKICDFGSAVIGCDHDLDQPTRLIVCTPPWDAPESQDDIDSNLSYKVDIYCYGLLACRVFLEGGDPFELWFQYHPLPPTCTEEVIVREWKQNDKILDVCKYAVKNSSAIQYSTEQLLVIEELLDITVRTDIESRANEYSEIKSILNPDLPKYPQDRYVGLACG